jgi:hypothetical protein
VTGHIQSTTQTDPGFAAFRANSRDPAFLLSLLVPALAGIYLLLTSTTTLIPGIWPYDAKRILQFALLVSLFLITTLNGRIRGQFGQQLALVPTWLKLTLLLVFCWGALSALVNSRTVMHALNSLSEVVLLFSLVLGIFAIAACRVIGGQWFDRIAIGLIALTGLAVGLQELIGVLAAHAADLDFSYRISLLHYSLPRFYNQVQSWMVPVLLVLPALFARRPLAVVICLTALSLQWYILLMTGARGSIVALFAAFFWALVFLPFIRKQLVLWQISGLVLGVAIYALVAFSFEYNTQELSQPVVQPTGQALDYAQDNPQTNNKFLSQSIGRPMTTTSGRSWMWRVVLDDAIAHPWLGIGPMNYACTRPFWFGHPHNFPVQIAGEWGIPVAVVLCLIVAYLLLSLAMQTQVKRH